MRRLWFCLALACLSSTGCAVGPNYHRPNISVPTAYRGQPPRATPQTSAASLGNQKWSQVFRDPVLQQLIRTALQQNYDVRIAATRVLEAQAELGITQANQFPMAAAGAQALSERNPKISSAFGSYQTNLAEADLSVIWNLDFWGKYRRESEAARDNLLATEWGRRAVITSVVSSVATDYFQLRELDLALEISQSTLASRQDSLRLTRVLTVNGSSSLLDLRQAEELVDMAAEQIPDLERQIQQEEDGISDLLGENPGFVARGLKLTDEPVPPVVPAGLPSELLERRPDIREAEANLMAANADVGVAKAAYFPNISLTGTAGFESYALSKLFTGSAGLWNTAGSLTQPVFEAGGLRSGMRLARAQEEQLLLTYKQTIIGAFQQVSDALVAYRKDCEFREQLGRLASAAQDADRLSKILYQHGGASYLQVLTSETDYFAAELNLAQAQLNERLALVQLYDALGGGWQQ
ncbi:MAG: efflux transporter outer membrane subunit [Candidatus Acidiferrales bacterium]